MNYITLIITPNKMQLGGFGHIMNDVLSAYIIGQIFKCAYVHYPIKTLNDDYHRDCSSTKYNSEYFNKLTDWDAFLRFGDAEVKYSDIPETINRVELSITAFTTFSLEYLQNIIDSHTNTLFILTNNSRVYLNEIYHHPIYSKYYPDIYSKLRCKLQHLHRKEDVKRVCIHIRRGDWDWQPLEYTQNIIRLLRSECNREIHVYAIGSESQLQHIKDNIDADGFHFNSSVTDTITDFYNADILVGGHSCFPKIVALFSSNTFIYLPFNDGQTRVLGGGVTGGTRMWGNSIESIDADRWIMTDIFCNLNRQKIINKLK
jgi:hypothetical protein